MSPFNEEPQLQYDFRQCNVSLHKPECEEETEKREWEDGKVGLRKRLKHFTWAWFTGTMSSGGISILLAETPHRFNGLDTLGVIVFLFDLAFFLVLCTIMCIRAWLYPKHFINSLTRPIECFYFPAFWLTIATILGCIAEYGADYERAWLIKALRIFFWIYAGSTVVTTWLQYWAFIRFTPSNIFEMNPAWFLPGFAVMLTGTLASLLSKSQPPESRIPILVGGLTYQGFGFLLSYLLYVLYGARLMNSGMPPRDFRAGLFFPVGHVGYTITALLGLSNNIPRDYGYFADHPASTEILQVMALYTGIFLWLFGFFMFGIAVLGCIECVPRMGFTLAWWAFVFPNIGFTLATVRIGRAFRSEGILWLTSVMTIILVVVWLFCLIALARAVWMKRIMWPGRDEDKDRVLKSEPGPAVGS